MGKLATIYQCVEKPLLAENKIYTSLLSTVSLKLIIDTEIRTRIRKSPAVEIAIRNFRGKQ